MNSITIIYNKDKAQNEDKDKESAIMEQYVRCVERFIEAQPDNWLWSHRRWKHQRPQKEEA